MASKFSEKKCPMCTFEARSVKIVLSHLRSVHSNDPRFNVMCGLEGCSHTFRTFSALYSHIYRRHRSIGIVTSDKYAFQRAVALPEQYSSQLEDDMEVTDHLTSYDDHYIPNETQADLDYLMGSREQQRRTSALFLLKLKEQRRITQIAINDIVTGVEHILQEAVVRAEAGVRAKLAENGIDESSVNGLDDVFAELKTPFDGLETEFKQEKYFKTSLNMLEPQEIKIGVVEHVPRFSGDKREMVTKYDTFQYVPLLQTLENLLQDRSVREEIDAFPRRMRNDSKLSDFCDGELFKAHPLFSTDFYALQIVAYFDELEVCNPLGTHIKRHKLGIVFFTLGNVRPEYRSNLKAINLVVVATTPVIEKYGLNQILDPFLKDLNTLATTGVSVTHDGIERTYRGALLTFLADNLASNSLGGFKESFSFSFRYCRTCLGTNDDVKSNFSSNSFEPRAKDTHEKHCQSLESEARSHFSTTYGINTRSCLMDVKYFSMFDGGLPHDCMHDILEGVAALEIKLLLSYCISSKYLSLDDYNKRLVNFNFGYTETDKPIPLLSSKFAKQKVIKSSASQMLSLMRNLPFLIGSSIPEGDEHWKCYLILRKILDIVVCPMLPSSVCATLKLLIIEHHTIYVSLYGYENFIPKMHFLVHYPEQIYRLGPMTRTWTMRHEAKLNFFKQASRLANFKNIALSVACRHQRWMCYELSTGCLFSSPLECGPGPSPTPLHQESSTLKEGIATVVPFLSMDSMVFRPTWVCYQGIKYVANNCFLIKGSDDLNPIFVQLCEILVISSNLVTFVVLDCNVLYFDDHFHSYVVEITSNKSIITMDNLYDCNVYHAHRISGSFYVSLKYYFV